VCDLFIDKPSKEWYPTYYTTIKKPIDIKTIEASVAWAVVVLFSHARPPVADGCPVCTVGSRREKNGMCHRAPPQAKALKKRKYGSLAAFRADVALLIANAHAFNEVRDDVSSKDLGS
jgi:hypothetical protein